MRACRREQHGGSLALRAARLACELARTHGKLEWGRLPAVCNRCRRECAIMSGNVQGSNSHCFNVLAACAYVVGVSQVVTPVRGWLPCCQ